MADWQHAALPTDLRPAAEAAALGIYIHWPFCIAKCPYCDFNSTAAAAIDFARWQRALERDLLAYVPLTPGRAVTSVFFGGGTPSLMPPETVATILAAVRAQWTVGDGVEITLEANPSTVDRSRFRDLRAAGVNRLSIGVQSFADEELRFLGRTHSAAEAKAAIETAHAVFPRVSFDLIYGLPGQTAAAWAQALNDALSCAGDHLSTYQLTIAPGTPFARRGVRAADEDLGLALFATTDEVLARAGFAAYEISNHARSSAVCRHNVAIWQGGNYLAVGPGAHGRLTLQAAADAAGTRALHQVEEPSAWLKQVEETGSGLNAPDLLSAIERRDELVLMGLRLAAGLERQRFRHLTGRHPEDVLNRAALDRLTAEGYLVCDAAGVRVTTKGRPCLDHLSATLLC
ncbi:MAG: coproporphyrinogen III oxidase [Rhodospirillales bacterium]|nr:coproporphyrinogen III oxidase [Rhodospirillales bacterium]